MTYLDGVSHDVFVSYAFDDDTTGPTGVRWVSEIVNNLTASLRQRLGCRDQLKVFFGSRDLVANGDLDQLEDHVQKSAIFIAVLSPSYVTGEYTRRELDAFTQTTGYEDRLFVVEMLPLDAQRDYPAVLAQKSRGKFWHMDEMSSHVPLTLDPRLDQPEYTRKVLCLAGDVRNRIIKLRDDRRPPNPSSDVRDSLSGNQSNPSPQGKVLLAQCTDELEIQRQQVKSYLEQMGVEVLPKYDYPQGGDDFRAAFTKDLQQADLYVQLVGSAQGRRPPDLPEGYSVCQFQLADASSKPMLLWRHPQIDTHSLESGAYKDILSAPYVVVSGLESFKANIVSSLQKARQPQRARPMSLVYVGADRADLPIAKQLQQALCDRQYSVVIPTFDGNSEDIREDIEGNLMDSDTLVFVHGSAPSTWLRSNLRRLHKLMALRERPHLRSPCLWHHHQKRVMPVSRFPTLNLLTAVAP